MFNFMLQHVKLQHDGKIQMEKLLWKQNHIHTNCVQLPSIKTSMKSKTQNKLAKNGYFFKRFWFYFQAWNIVNRRFPVQLTTMWHIKPSFSWLIPHVPGKTLCQSLGGEWPYESKTTLCKVIKIIWIFTKYLQSDQNHMNFYQIFTKVLQMTIVLVTPMLRVVLLQCNFVKTSFKHFHMSMPERARDSRLSLMKLMQILLQLIWLL